MSRAIFTDTIEPRADTITLTFSAWERGQFDLGMTSDLVQALAVICHTLCKLYNAVASEKCRIWLQSPLDGHQSCHCTVQPIILPINVSYLTISASSIIMSVLSMAYLPIFTSSHEFRMLLYQKTPQWTKNQILCRIFIHWKCRLTPQLCILYLIWYWLTPPPYTQYELMVILDMAIK